MNLKIAKSKKFYNVNNTTTSTNYYYDKKKIRIIYK